MVMRLFSMAALALAMLAGTTQVLAQEIESDNHDGKIVSITAEKLVMTGEEGKEHSHALTAAAKLTLDGKECKAADLKAGTRIRVTTKKGDTKTVTKVEAIDKNKEFAVTPQDGKVVSVTGTKLVMTGMHGPEEQICTMSDNVEVTCDGKVCKSSDLKPGMRIRVSMDTNNPHTATRIEALNKNAEFAAL